VIEVEMIYFLIDGRPLDSLRIVLLQILEYLLNILICHIRIIKVLFKL